MIEDVGVAARADALKQLTGPLRSTAPPFPRSAKIELDSTCNLSCRFCTRTWRKRTPVVMDRRMFRDIVRDLRACGVDQLGLFYMNEPFMCDWLPDAIRWAKGDGGMPYVFLMTNGLEATEGPKSHRHGVRGMHRVRCRSGGRAGSTVIEKDLQTMAAITERIDSVTRIPEDHLRAAPPAPKSVKIEISPRCNYRCGFCALRTREVQPKWDMDFGLFTHVTRQMREAGVEEIGVFYLGESFMNPRLSVDCIAYLKRELEMPYVFLTSNASRAFPEAVDACSRPSCKIRSERSHEGRVGLAQMVGECIRRGAVRSNHGGRWAALSSGRE